MKTGLRENEQGPYLGNAMGAGATDDDVTSEPTVSRNRQVGTSKPRWRAAASMLAMAFAVLTWSCDTASEKTDAEEGPTTADAEVMKEDKLNRDYECLLTRSVDRNTKEPKMTIYVPVSGKTKAERRREAESPQATERLKFCYQKFGVELPAQLSTADATVTDIGKSVSVIRAAHANNPPCLASVGGSCSWSSADCSC